MRRINLNLEKQGKEELIKRIEKAIKFAESGQADGAHHKDWAIDQMVRALLGCETKGKIYKDGWGTPYTASIQGESPEYKEFVKQYEGNKRELIWNTGISI
jgi:hypothetical protein